VRVAGAWHDCNGGDGLVRLDGWTGALRCPNATEMCAESEDLGWPELASLSPTHGPAEGGTRLTVVGTNLGPAVADGENTTTRVFLCGVEAAVLSFDASNASAGASATEKNASAVAAATALSPQRLVATSGASPSAEGNTSCHLRVLRADGRYAENFEAFTYVGPPPSQPPLDFSDFDSDTFIAVCIRYWPYALTLMIGLEMLHSAYAIGTAVKRSRGHGGSGAPHGLAPGGALPYASALPPPGGQQRPGRSSTANTIRRHRSRTGVASSVEMREMRSPNAQQQQQRQPQQQRRPPGEFLSLNGASLSEEEALARALAESSAMASEGGWRCPGDEATRSGGGAARPQSGVSSDSRLFPAALPAFHQQHARGVDPLRRATPVVAGEPVSRYDAV